jgi:hypothetical protein
VKRSFNLLLLITAALFCSLVVAQEPTRLFKVELNDDYCLSNTRSELQNLYCHDLAKSAQESKNSSKTVYIPSFDDGYVAKRELTLSPEHRELLDKTGYSFIIGSALMGVMTKLPEGITKWNDEELGDQSLIDSWHKNTSRGPVRDRDSIAVNWIGHPLSGSAYYTMARSTGFGPAESFVYSTLMSTIFWEYGLEATAEVPSIQDLIITPIVGSLVGEVFYNLHQKIDKNGGAVLGSTSLGSVTKVLLNPLDFLIKGPRMLLKPIIGDVEMRPSIEVRGRDRSWGPHAIFKIEIPLYAGQFEASKKDKPVDLKCVMAKLPQLNGRTISEVKQDADRLFSKSRYCHAAINYGLIDLEDPGFSKKHGVSTKILESLLRGKFYRSFFAELENNLLAQRGSNQRERWEFLRLEAYLLLLSKDRCMVKRGIYSHSDQNELSIVEEGIYFADQFISDYPTSRYREVVDVLVSKMKINYQLKQMCLTHQ